jgi:hypothetical protein
MNFKMGTQKHLLHVRQLINKVVHHIAHPRRRKRPPDLRYSSPERYFFPQSGKNFGTRDQNMGDQEVDLSTIPLLDRFESKVISHSSLAVAGNLLTWIFL